MGIPFWLEPQSYQYFKCSPAPYSNDFCLSGFVVLCPHLYRILGKKEDRCPEFCLCSVPVLSSVALTHARASWQNPPLFQKGLGSQNVSCVLCWCMWLLFRAFFFFFCIVQLPSFTSPNAMCCFCLFM